MRVLLVASVVLLACGSSFGALSDWFNPSNWYRIRKDVGGKCRLSMVKPITVYYAPPSPPSRMVRMVTRALGLKVDEKPLNIAPGGDTSKDWYLKLNPMHSVPVIVDGDTVIIESRAILTYLVDKYAKKDTLYPRDIKKRAMVDQRLYFEATTLNARMMALYAPFVFSPPPKPQLGDPSKLNEAFSVLNKFLENDPWVAGDDITVADFAMAVTVSTAQVLGYDISKYDKVVTWLANCKANLPGYDINEAGAEAFKKMAGL